MLFNRYIAWKYECIGGMKMAKAHRGPENLLQPWYRHSMVLPFARDDVWEC